MARSGLAWLTIDMEHGHVDWDTTANMVGMIAEAGCTPLVRVPANRHDHIKRALDNGAMGVVVPMVNSREEALAAVAAAKYPPAGTRSIGGSVHALNYGTNANDYYSHANDEILVVLQCEHITAVENFDSIFSVPGIDAVFVGPNDLAASMRGKDGKPPSGEATTQVMKRILEGCRRNKVPAGAHCGSPEEARLRIEDGWQFLAVASELRMLLDAAGTVVKKLGGQQTGEMAKY
jgi:4-hydroxy-2-oxoheptanedioate aldolase